MAIDNVSFSVLVPSRERAQALKFSLDSLGLERNNLEVLVWVDDDDSQINEYHRLFDKDSHVKLFIKPRVGYGNFHGMMNFLASKASGVWLFLWNDDAYMANIDWYDKFSEYASLSSPRIEPVIYNLCGQGSISNAFPIASIKYFKLLGHIANNASCDFWMRDVAVYSHIQRTIFGISPHHRKNGDDDRYLGDLEYDNTKRDIDVLRSTSRHLDAISRGVIQAKNQDISKIDNWMRRSKNRANRVGFIGLDALGLLQAIAIESRGKNVVAYTEDPNIKKYIIEMTVPIQQQELPFREQKLVTLLGRTRIEFVDSVKQVVRKCNLIFGNFNSLNLKTAVKEVVAAANKFDDKTTFLATSSCRTGTYEKEIKPVLSPKVNYIYNPLFIKEEAVINSFLNLVNILIGTNKKSDATLLVNFYKMILGADNTMITSISQAEMSAEK